MAVFSKRLARLQSKERSHFFKGQLAPINSPCCSARCCNPYLRTNHRPTCGKFWIRLPYVSSGVEFAQPLEIGVRIKNYYARVRPDKDLLNDAPRRISLTRTGLAHDKGMVRTQRWNRL